MFGKIQQRCIESGTVVVVDGTNLLLYRFTAEDRGIHGEIAALGVPADKQRSERKRGCCLLQIVCRVALRRNSGVNAMLKSSFQPTIVSSVPRKAT